MQLSLREKIFSISLVLFGGTGLCVVVYSLLGSNEFVIPYAIVSFISAVCALMTKPHKKSG